MPSNLWKICDFGRDAVWCNGCGAAGVIDDVADFAFVVEGDCDHVVKAYAGIDRDFNGSSDHDVRMPEDAIDAKTPGLVTGDVVGDFVGGPAVGVGSAGVAGLIWWIVGNFRLVEVRAAAVTVP